MERERGDGGPVSEQQEGFEPGRGAVRGGAVGGNAGMQFTVPGDHGDFTDDEPDPVADIAGPGHLLGPEDAAMHIEDDSGPGDEFRDFEE
ncbi:hypothetical protein ACIGNX_17895 [Actinosynnema sp. NPDC053489]|uniref:hypothetical protein n=1 Tax=Actinosynnema sp. NPDC053489 TaxID=3363916 RepID=UPI0037C9A7C3